MERVGLIGVGNIGRHFARLLTQKGYPLVVLDRDPERVDLSLRVTGLDRYFEGRIFNAAMVEHSKPAPDLFLAAAAAMGAAPARSLVVEDSVNGVIAGKAAGMTVWGFVGGSHHRNRPAAEKLKAAGADRILQSMTEFRT